MESSMQVWPKESRVENGELLLSADIQMTGSENKNLWFKMPEAYADRIGRNCDPFAIAVVMLAMKAGCKLHMHGVVSRSLLRNLEEFQAAWSCWLPNRLAEVEMVVDEVEEQVSSVGKRTVATSFSGGVDSCFTAYMHATKRMGWRNLPVTSGLFVHGLDIPLSDPEGYRSISKRVEVLLNSLGLEMLRMSTNLRDVLDPHVNWINSFGTGVAACLSIFQGCFFAGLIPGSYAYDVLHLDNGSNPIGDPLLGSDSFRIVHDGARYRRFDKIKAINEWPEAREHLRVCWQGASSEYNCCRCEKCIRNILTFRALGVPQPPCFPRDVDDDQIRMLELKGASLNTIANLVDSARKAGIRESWLSAAEYALRKGRRKMFIKTRVNQPINRGLKRIKVRRTET